MKILNSKTLTQALKNIFKSESNYLKERLSLAKKITEKNSILYDDVNKETSNANNLIMSEWQSGNIPKEEARRKISELNEKQNLQKENINSAKDNSLFEEYEKKYKKSLEINGFENKMIFLNYETYCLESIEYKKYYSSNSFEVKFEFEKSDTEKNVSSINLTASDSDSNDNFISMTINIGENKEFEIQSFSVFTEEKKVRFSKIDVGEDGIAILSTIKEEDLLNLDSSEREELSLMIHDCSINLSNVPLYKVFKEGLKDFEKEIEKALAVKKKITNKI